MASGRDWLVVLYRRRPRLLAPEKWAFNPYTPPGEDAIYWEIKPFNGRRYFDYGDIKYRSPFEEEARKFLETARFVR